MPDEFYLKVIFARIGMSVHAVKTHLKFPTL